MRTMKSATCPDGSSISIGTEIIRKSDGLRFKIEQITTEGPGQYDPVTIVAKRHDESLTLNRQGLDEFEINRSTVYPQYFSGQDLNGGWYAPSSWETDYGWRDEYSW